jgi:hypothetical protein
MGKPPSWPRPEDRLANQPPPSDAVTGSPSGIPGPPTPAPWQPANTGKRRLPPRSITPFTRYMTPIPIVVRKDPNGVPLTIPNNSNIKKIRARSTPRPRRSQVPSSGDSSLDEIQKAALLNDATCGASCHAGPSNPPPRDDADCQTQ